MTAASAHRPLKHRLAILAGITGLHGALLALITASAGTVTPPQALPTVQGMLIASSQAPTVVRPRAVPPPSKAPRPEPAPTVPQPPPQAPPSERAISQPPMVAKQSQDSIQPALPARDEQPPATTPENRDRAANEGAPVTQPRIDAGHLNNPAPVYPALSRRLGEQGRVLLDVLILPDGSVGEMRLKSSSGFPRLDAAALSAVRRWRYQPARRGSTPIAYWYVQPIIFSLHN